ncbi:hypothetical protein CHS0354_029604 [Potamilus streckersoni]|uniref:Uncharacterized protein n=1 Tax=Potamilus streckersoni TaxID=2493646 RepID=A0AAE0VJN8_9BIVA|nr:hypothetical protein CHS0354_029604 [Potamilus streckersoni]
MAQAQLKGLIPVGSKLKKYFVPQIEGNRLFPLTLWPYLCQNCLPIKVNTQCKGGQYHQIRKKERGKKKEDTEEKDNEIDENIESEPDNGQWTTDKETDNGKNEETDLDKPSNSDKTDTNVDNTDNLTPTKKRGWVPDILLTNFINKSKQILYLKCILLGP